LAFSSKSSRIGLIIQNRCLLGASMMVQRSIGLAIDDDGTQSALMHGFTLRFVHGIA
jgi:hypothetical protein